MIPATGHVVIISCQHAGPPYDARHLNVPAHVLAKWIRAARTFQYPAAVIVHPAMCPHLANLDLISTVWAIREHCRRFGHCSPPALGHDLIIHPENPTGTSIGSRISAL